MFDRDMGIMHSGRMIIISDILFLHFTQTRVFCNND